MINPVESTTVVNKGLLITAGSNLSFVKIIGNKLPNKFDQIVIATIDKPTTIPIVGPPRQKSHGYIKLFLMSGRSVILSIILFYNIKPTPNC